MNLGELFFSLGFKSSGAGDAAAFSSSIDVLNSTMIELQNTVDTMLVVLENVAMKLQLMSEAQVKQNRAAHLAVVATKEHIKYGKIDQDYKKKDLSLFTQLHQKIKEHVGGLNAIRLETIAGMGAVIGFVNHYSKFAVELDKINSITGVSTDKMQELGSMAAQSGVDISTLSSAVEHLQSASTNIKLGRGDISPYMLLGLDPHQDPIKLLNEDIPRALQKLPKAMRATMAHNLGIGDDLLYFMNNLKNIKPPAKETIITEKEVQRLKEFNMNFNRIWEQSKRVLTKFAALMTPVISLMINGADSVSLMFADIANRIGPIMDKIPQWIPLITALGLVLGAALFPKTAKALGILGIFDDLFAYIEGRESALGRFLSWVFDVNKGLSTMVDLFHWIKSGIEDAFSFLPGVTAEDGATEAFKQKKSLIDSIKNNPTLNALFDPDLWHYGSGKKGVDMFKGPTMGPKSDASKQNTNNVNINVQSTAPADQLGDELDKHYNKKMSDLYFQQPLEFA